MRERLTLLLVLCSLLIACGGGSTPASSPPPPPPVQFKLTIAVSGTGTVTSGPAGINCPTTCTAQFDTGTVVKLTATAGTGFAFSGFGGACSGTTCQVALTRDQSVTAAFSAAPPATLTVVVSGSGTVISSPAGINCPTACTATFASGTTTTLTATPASGSSFEGYSGACSGQTCQLALTRDQSVAASFGTASLQSSINHIIFMTQENRSFDHYFSHLPEYWQANNFPQASNGTTLDVESSTDFNLDPNGVAVYPYELITQCIENPSPSWDESHVDFNWHNAVSSTYLGDGFVHTASQEGQLYDLLGHRVMGYYTEKVLNYYYFMASSFATSDRWFSPELSRSQLNHPYKYAATSGGHVYPFSGSTAKTMPQLLDENGITWKIYVHPGPDLCSTPTCLARYTYLNEFTYLSHVMSVEPNNIASTAQFLADAASGTLPQVAWIEPASAVALDEHPTDDAGNPTVVPVAVQPGAKFVASLINGLMISPSWKDSVFILTYDEGGGIWDHVSPMSTVNPAGTTPISPAGTPEIPVDLGKLGYLDICENADGSVQNTPTCRFEYTGYRVPLIVVSPFTKKNYVSHTPMDYSAVLKLVEERFNLPSLTLRDGAQASVTEFFDFAKVPWATPPTPPGQLTNAPCYLNALP
jgi:phospholipase C